MVGFIPMRKAIEGILGAALIVALVGLAISCLVFKQWYLAGVLFALALALYWLSEILFFSRSIDLVHEDEFKRRLENGKEEA